MLLPTLLVTLHGVAALTVQPGYSGIYGGQPLLLTLGTEGVLDIEQPHCIIGDTVVAAVPINGGAQLSCTAVPAPGYVPGSVTISTDVTPNATATLVYYDESTLPSVSSVSPRSGMASTPTTVHVFGSNFAPLGETLLCGFGSDELSTATFVSPNELLCTSPVTNEPTHSARAPPPGTTRLPPLAASRHDARACSPHAEPLPLPSTRRLPPLAGRAHARSCPPP